MPTSPNTPVILVGPGTGVAPMRAFFEYRISQGAASNTILYFGCRSAKADLYYAEEWETMRKQGVRVKGAASRDQESKIYVQDLIKRDRALIHDWVKQQRGHVYISGLVAIRITVDADAVQIIKCHAQRGQGVNCLVFDIRRCGHHD
jgi:sulfite reductase alpha subunit-like flavoprotein